MAQGRPFEGRVVRFATSNASLNRDKAGELLRDLSTPENVQARNVAEIIQRSGPDDFWPEESDPLARLVRMSPVVASSDHRLVYLDLAIDEGNGTK